GSAVKDVIEKAVGTLADDITNHKGDVKNQKTVTLFHEKDGTVVAEDSDPNSYFPGLLFRRKAQAVSPLAAVPKTGADQKPLVDGMKIPRRSTIQWRWTGGARAGSVELVDRKTGKRVVRRASASTAKQALTILMPGRYILRLRNISRFDDPWLEINFTI